MKTFRIVVSVEAKADIDALFEYIVYEYKSEDTAVKYIDELTATIKNSHFRPKATAFKQAAFLRGTAKM